MSWNQFTSFLNWMYSRKIPPTRLFSEWATIGTMTLGYERGQSRPEMFWVITVISFSTLGLVFSTWCSIQIWKKKSLRTSKQSQMSRTFRPHYVSETEESCWKLSHTGINYPSIFWLFFHSNLWATDWRDRIIQSGFDFFFYGTSTSHGGASTLIA